MPGQPDLDNVAKLDRLPIPCIRTMQRVGIAIDREYLRELSSQLGSEMEQLERDIAGYIPPDALHRFVDLSTDDFNANSADDIRLLLFDVLGIGKRVSLKKTAGGVVSTGKRQLELCRQDHPVVGKVLQYRERSKLRSTYTDSLADQARLHPRGECPVCELHHDAETWRVHTEFPTTRAATWRLASRSPNLQNIPIRTDLGQKIRAAFTASPSKKLVSADFSQIELRDLAHLANERTMIGVYESGGDIHVTTAMKAFKIDDQALVDKYKHRLPSKRVNFGIQNGTTEIGLHAQLVMDYSVSGMEVPAWLTEDWCRWFIDAWFDAYPEVRPYLAMQHYRARRYGFVWNPFGFVRRVPEVQSCHSWVQEAGLRQAQNLPITSSSAAQIKLGMSELADIFADMRNAGAGVWPLLSIHDQVIAECDEEIAEDVAAIMSSVFAGVMNDRETGERLWRCPIEADAEITDRWGVTE